MDSLKKFAEQVIPVPLQNSRVNYQACKECAKKQKTCCQVLPCYICPEEIVDLSFQGICNLIDTGLVSLDWWEGNPLTEDYSFFDDIDRTYFLRMRGKDSPVVHGTFSFTECAVLRPEEGCMLPYTHRPKGGRDYIPPHCDDNPNDCCISEYSKQDAAIDWMPYQDILRAIHIKYRNFR